jgi:hypothetical protein
VESTGIARDSAFSERVMHRGKTTMRIRDAEFAMPDAVRNADLKG